MIDTLIKEKAADKAFAKVMTLEKEIRSLNREVKSGGSGGISLEQLLSVVDHTEVERYIWIYILCLIEKDNV